MRSQRRVTGPNPRATRDHQTGFSLVTAVFLLVVLGGLAAAIVTVTGMQQSTLMLDVQGSRAYQAARAGIEWGAFQSLRNGNCGGTVLAFPDTTLAGFSTTVTCTRTPANEAGVIINIDEYIATACNLPPCPNPNPQAGTDYAERQLRIVVGR
ncbi:MAG: agglutinin biogenesis protein MshP [Burkholderiales bacterium]|nr:agglutinin biogenesis protein MshP [Burkholderiales bacterium]